jgi:hypothetical protein
MKGHLSSPSVAFVFSSKSPPSVVGRPLSLHRMKMKMKVMKSTLMCLLLVPNWKLTL